MMMLAAILIPVLFGVGQRILKTERKAPRFILLFTGLASGAGAVIAALCGVNAPLTLLPLPGGLSFGLSCDRLSYFFALLACVIFGTSGVFAVRYMDKEENLARFLSYFLLANGAFYGLCFSGNLLTFYLFFEATTLFSFPLVLHEQSPEAMRGAKKYLFYSMGGAFLALGGIVILIASSGGGLSFTAPLSGQGGTLTAVGLFLAVLGFSAKAGMFPLHAWLPAAHPVCPAPASALLSGLVVKAGVLGIIRTAYCAADPAILRGTPFQIALLVLACLTVVCGSAMALFEPVLKRRLAYSTVSNLSYILMGLFLFTEGGLSGALFHTLAHAMAKTALFLLVGEIIYRTGVTEGKDLRGLGKKMPVTFALFLTAGLSLIGIPPFAGFLSKWQLCTAAIADAPGAFRYILPGCLLLSALLSAGYLLKPVISAFYEAPEREIGAEKGSAWFLAPTVLLCALGLVIGILGVPVGNLLAGIL